MTKIGLLFALMLTSCFFFTFKSIGQNSLPIEGKKKYAIIKRVKRTVPNHANKAYAPEINQKDISRLTEPLRALAAYYSAYSGSDCNLDSKNQEFCKLTDALGLGDQGSEKHKLLLKKWFPKDTIVKEMIHSNCAVSISGSSDFYNYSYLFFTRKDDTIFIDYQINHFYHGKGDLIKKQEIALVKNNEIIFIKRYR